MSRITRRVLIFSGVLSLALVTGCARQNAESSAAADSPAASSLNPPNEPTADQLSSAAATQTIADRQFIRAAEAEFRVKDVYRTSQAIEDITARAGGYVESNSIRNDVENTRRVRINDKQVSELATYIVRGQITVRVPSAGTQMFLRDLMSQMESLDSRTFTAKDAALDILRRQVETQRARDERLALEKAAGQGGNLDQKTAAIVAQARAQANGDEAELGRRELADQVAFSTIRLSLYQNPQVRVTQMENARAIYHLHSPGFGYRSLEAVRSGWYGLKEFIVLCMRVWPLWLALILGFLGFRKWRQAVPARGKLKNESSTE